MLGALVGLITAGFVGLIVLMVVGMMFGLVFGIFGFAALLALKVVPLLLCGWLVVKLVRRAERPRELPRYGGGLSTADRNWLDT
ncbi:MAG TPA: hypothetical protein VFX98_06645 [Longimicrobiaceae bacterium]|nr:hypothetical protein [Longimicrobiaceae bacterium]